MIISEITTAETSKIKSILSTLTSLNGVNTAVCAGRDEFEIDSSGLANTDVNTIGAMVSPGVGAAECVGKMLCVGTLSLTVIECTSSFVVIVSVGSDFFW
jgi:predicted regulator of Ras-like GTPase activity (Roadblock/LC7/MglB family)